VGGDLQSFVDVQRSFGADGDTLEIFLQNFEDRSLGDRVEEVVDFCKSASLEELQKGWGASGLQQALAWLDERSLPTAGGIAGKRAHKNPLTASQLYNRLSLPVSNMHHLSSRNLKLIQTQQKFNLAGMPDADRRLM
jgi:hypothetical protein